MSVSARLAELLASLELDQAGQVKAAAATRLAAALDAADDLKSLPALVKELRATIDELAPVAVDDDDWTTGTVAASSGDATQSKPTDSRARGGRGGSPVGEAVVPLAAARRGRGVGAG